MALTIVVVFEELAQEECNSILDEVFRILFIAGDLSAIFLLLGRTEHTTCLVATSLEDTVKL